MRSERILVVLMAMVLLAIPEIAGADPNDAIGPLDIHRVRGERRPGGVVTIRIVTYENWATPVLDHRGRNRLWVHLDTNAKSDVDHRAVIYAGVHNRLIMASSGKGASFLPVAARHPNGHTVVVSVPSTQRINPDRPWRFYTTARYVNARSCRTPCRDRAPESRWVKIDALQ